MYGGIAIETKRMGLYFFIRVFWNYSALIICHNKDDIRPFTILSKNRIPIAN